MKQKGEEELTHLSIQQSKSRRSVLASLATTATILSSSAGSATAAISEISREGNLYTPKAQMLQGGGSDAARGMKQTSSKRDSSNRSNNNSNLGLIQNVYDTRFIAYLSRFLLNFDPAAKGWLRNELLRMPYTSLQNDKQQVKLLVADFTESVEVGLADYFVGPYGSYASVQAAKAGLTATQPATSAIITNKSSTPTPNIQFQPFQSIFDNDKNTNTISQKNIDKKNQQQKSQGVRNLFALLKARFENDIQAKQQLVILFSLINDPNLQPSEDIKSLLGEIDNAQIDTIQLQYPPTPTAFAQQRFELFRCSTRFGGGYSLDEIQDQNAKDIVKIEAPPALGTNYQSAIVEPKFRPTSRILKINVLDGGEGYTTSPTVTVLNKNNKRITKPCEACAILDRENGSIESIIVLNPGSGYTSNSVGTLKVEIKPPKRKNKTKTSQQEQPQRKIRTATAEAELEYELYDIDLVKCGNGYSISNPPKISIRPPKEEPDWFILPNQLSNRQRDDSKDDDTTMSMNYENLDYLDNSFVTAKVKGMSPVPINDKTPMTSDFSFEIKSDPTGIPEIDISILRDLQNDPLALIPTTIRPQSLQRSSEKNDAKDFFVIPKLPPPSSNKLTSLADLPSARYRAYDPFFGGVGKTPVTKGAKQLNAGEYSRLAFSGALCTVIVRTALNPLELVKTKLQLKNDKELSDYASAKKKNSSSMIKHNETMAEKDEHYSKNPRNQPLVDDSNLVVEDANDTSLGTLDVMKSLVELRGPSALFQSADITFLASLVFGSFGFGATELFRRSFSMEFFSEDNPGSESFVLLAAAAFATVLTSYAAAPFEIIRVRSMATIEALPWKTVFGQFIEEKRQERNAETHQHESKLKKRYNTPVTTKRRHEKKTHDDKEKEQQLKLTDLEKSDFSPLFSGFPKIVSRELPFAVTKFLIFDLAANTLIVLIQNSNPDTSLDPIKVGVGPTGLAISAFAGAIAGVGAACVSHPADLILTLSSTSQKNESEKDGTNNKRNSKIRNSQTNEEEEADTSDWRYIVKELLAKDGGITNLFVGLPARASFFFLVIGLQFFLYDYVKNLFQVGSDDLTLVLDVFYSIRQGLQ